MNWRTNTLSRVWPGRLASRTHPTPVTLRPAPSANRAVPLLCTLPLTDPSAPPWKASSRTAPVLFASSASVSSPSDRGGGTTVHPALTSASCSSAAAAARPAKLQSGDAAGVTCKGATKVKVQMPPAIPPSSPGSKPKPSPQDRSGATRKTTSEGVFDSTTRYPVFRGSPPEHWGALPISLAGPGLSSLGLEYRAEQSRAERRGRSHAPLLPLLLPRGSCWQPGGRGEPPPPLPCQGRCRSRTWRRRCRC